MYKNIQLPFEEGCRFACCPYGGPIAVAQSNDRTNWTIFIFNAKGNIFCQFFVVELSKLFWTKCQKVISSYTFFTTVMFLISVGRNLFEWRSQVVFSFWG